MMQSGKYEHGNNEYWQVNAPVRHHWGLSIVANFYKNRKVKF